MSKLYTVNFDNTAAVFNAEAFALFQKANHPTKEGLRARKAINSQVSVANVDEGMIDDEHAAKIEAARAYTRRLLDAEDRASERIEQVAELSEDIIQAIIACRVEKDLPVKDIADIFAIPAPIVNLIVAAESEWDG